MDDSASLYHFSFIISSERGIAISLELDITKPSFEITEIEFILSSLLLATSISEYRDSRAMESDCLSASLMPGCMAIISLKVFSLSRYSDISLLLCDMDFLIRFISSLFIIFKVKLYIR